MADGFWKFMKKKPPQQEPEQYLRRVGPGTAMRFELKTYSTEKVEWVSQETDAGGNPRKVRQPSQTVACFSARAPFSMAGKIYPNLKSFLKHQQGEWGEDLYGRQVFCTKERFPCFDSYDYLYEDRYFRWYFIRSGNTLSQLFVTDERDKIYVTEDVEDLEPRAWKRMQETGFCQQAKKEAEA